MSPPTSSHGLPSTSAPSTNGAAPPVPPKTTPKTDSGFFADLPIAPKLRARPSGAFTPQLGRMPTPPMNQQQFPPRAGPPQTPGLQTGPPQPPQRSVAPPTQPQPPIVGGFRQPERQELFPDQPPVSTPSLNEILPTPAAAGRYSPSKQIPSTAPAPPTNRYSPAPATNAQAPAAGGRYSPAPVAQPQQQQVQQPPQQQQPPQAQPPPPTKTAQRYSSAPTPSAPAISRAASSFVPRTSSPLAMHGRPSQTQAQHETPEGARSVPFTPTSPPSTNGYGLSPERRDSSGSKYAPSAGQQPDFGAAYPPQRPRTQSPGNVMKVAKTGFTPIERPGSAGAGSAVNIAPPASQASVVRLAHRRQFSRELAFAVPQDERAQDPLERWKGHPIFKWSASGTIISSFPKQIPFYGSQGAPSIKCTPGTINMQNAKDVLP